MGWHSGHLHEFNDGLHRYLPPDPDFADFEFEARDDRKYKLRRLLKEGDRLRYVYDFGDSWEHVIAVEKVEPCDVSGSWCEVLDGARACPPEDVGGVPGYLARGHPGPTARRRRPRGAGLGGRQLRCRVVRSPGGECRGAADLQQLLGLTSGGSSAGSAIGNVWSACAEQKADMSTTSCSPARL